MASDVVVVRVDHLVDALQLLQRRQRELGKPAHAAGVAGAINLVLGARRATRTRVQERSDGTSERADSRWVAQAAGGPRETQGKLPVP